MNYPSYYHIAVDPTKRKYDVTYTKMRDFGMVWKHYFITFTREEFEEISKEYGAYADKVFDGTVDKIKITNLDTRKERTFKFFGLVPQGKTSYDRSGLVFISDSNDHITLQIL